MATFESNSTGDDEPINVDITVDEDDGIFLALSSMDIDLDLICASPYEIEQFFEEVERAKADYARLKGRSGEAAGKV